MGLLVCMSTFAAFFVTQAVLPFFDAGDQSDEIRIELFKSYGTFLRALLTMLEVTLGNWGPPTRLLVNHVSEAFIVFFVAYKITAGFAVLSVINAVFLRQTMKVADRIDGYAIEETKKAAESYRKKVRELFNAMDTSGDGDVTFDEFAEICENESFRAWMKLLNISTKNVGELFGALDDGDGRITRNEFIDGMSRLDGSATAVDAMSMRAAQRRMELNQVRILKGLTAFDAILSNS